MGFQSKLFPVLLSNDHRLLDVASIKVISTTANRAMNQSDFLAFICILLKGREKLCVQGAIIFGLASHWLINWREISKPITKRGNRSRVVTFHARMKSTRKYEMKSITRLCRLCSLLTTGTCLSCFIA